MCHLAIFVRHDDCGARARRRRRRPLKKGRWLTRSRSVRTSERTCRRRLPKKTSLVSPTRTRMDGGTRILIVRPRLASGTKWSKNDTHCIAWHLRPLVGGGWRTHTLARARGADVMNIFVLHHLIDAKRDLGAFYPRRADRTGSLAWLAVSRNYLVVSYGGRTRRAGRPRPGHPCALPLEWRP